MEGPVAGHVDIALCDQQQGTDEREKGGREGDPWWSAMTCRRLHGASRLLSGVLFQ
jgi:hypothetical protein